MGMMEQGSGFGGMSPVEFVREALGDEPHMKQVEMLEAVGRAAKGDRRRVSVVGCNGSGKDWAAARAILWWVHTRSPAKVIVTGPSARQVDRIVWNEMRAAYAGSAAPLEGRMARTSRYELDTQTFALGFASNSPYNVLGFHSPNLMVAITEAHGIGADYMDAVRRLHPNLLLLTGNAFAVAGEFYDSHHGKRDMYETVKISAMDTPNVAEGREVVPGVITREDIEDHKRDWGEDSPQYIASVLAEFPDNPDGVVVPLRVAAEAARRELPAEGDVVLACDVARFGSDKTVAVKRQGGKAEIALSVRGIDTSQTANFLRMHCERNRVDYLVVDDVGIGAGVVDKLREDGLGDTRIVPFIGNKEAKDKEHFFNRNAEVWWHMRERYMEGSISTDNSDELIGQVSSREYFIDGKGRVRLRDKKSGGRRDSPDAADALAMTFAVVSPPRMGDRSGLKVWV